jgi:hypothetical protein
MSYFFIGLLFRVDWNNILESLYTWGPFYIWSFSVVSVVFHPVFLLLLTVRGRRRVCRRGLLRIGKRRGSIKRENEKRQV